GVEHLVHSHGAKQRIGADLRHQLAVAADNARLRTAQQLVAAVGDDVHGSAQAVGDHGLAAHADIAQIEDLAAAEIFHDWDVVLASERDQFFQRRLLGEADDLEVRAMHAQQQSCAFGDGALVVGDARAIGSTDLAEDRARFGHDVRDAKRTADLDQFTARNQHLAAFGQRVQRQQHSGGVVVNHNGRDFALRSVEKLPEQAIDVDVAFAALASREVELQIRVSLRD